MSDTGICDLLQVIFVGRSSILHVKQIPWVLCIILGSYQTGAMLALRNTKSFVQIIFRRALMTMILAVSWL